MTLIIIIPGRMTFRGLTLRRMTLYTMTIYRMTLGRVTLGRMARISKKITLSMTAIKL
jgi:hypothetical protein